MLKNIDRLLFERKCVPFKRYTCANFTPLNVIWLSSGRDGKSGLSNLEILQAEFESACNIQGRN